MVKTATQTHPNQYAVHQFPPAEGFRQPSTFYLIERGPPPHTAHRSATIPLVAIVAQAFQVSTDPPQEGSPRRAASVPAEENKLIAGCSERPGGTIDSSARARGCVLVTIEPHKQSKRLLIGCGLHFRSHAMRAERSFCLSGSQQKPASHGGSRCGSGSPPPARFPSIASW